MISNSGHAVWTPSSPVNTTSESLKILLLCVFDDLVRLDVMYTRDWNAEGVMNLEKIGRVHGQRQMTRRTTFTLRRKRPPSPAPRQARHSMGESLPLPTRKRFKSRWVTVKAQCMCWMAHSQVCVPVVVSGGNERCSSKKSDLYAIWGKNPAVKPALPLSSSSHSSTECKVCNKPSACIAWRMLVTKERKWHQVKQTKRCKSSAAVVPRRTKQCRC